MIQIAIAFSFSTDPLAVAALKEFHIFEVDPVTHVRKGAAVVVQPNSIPTIDNPLSVSLANYGAGMLEVFAIDLNGKQGATTFAPVYGFLPAVNAVAQVTA